MKLSKNIILDFLLFKVGVPLGAWFIYCVSKSVRVTYVNKEYGMDGDKLKKGICAIWHNRLFLLSGWFAGNKVCAIISKSKDGEIIARIVEKFGFTSARGSSSKGGTEALLSAVRKEDTGFVLTLDGPRGPLYEIKDGIFFLASKSGLPIIPVTYFMDKKIKLNSWDKFIIPCPFAKAKIIFGKPIYIDKELSKEKIEEYKCQLKKELFFKD